LISTVLLSAIGAFYNTMLARFRGIHLASIFYDTAKLVLMSPIAVYVTAIGISLSEQRRKKMKENLF